MKNLNTVFPFYDRLDEQVRFKSPLTPVPFIVSIDTALPPFIIRRDHTDGANTDIKLLFYPCNGGTTLQINAEDVGVTITTGGTYDYIIYTGAALPAALPVISGGYYMVVKDTFPTVDKLWYSETFVVRASVSDQMKIDFHADTKLASICENFIQTIYLSESFLAPEYIREDVGEKRDGIQVKEKQIMMKSQMVRLVQAPEYVVEGLLLLPMMDSVTVTTSSDVYTFQEIRVKDPEWSDPALAVFARMEISFISGVVIKKLNYKETVGGGDMGYIKQGTGITVVQIGGDYAYNVVFDEDMPDQDYTPAAYAISTGEMKDAQLPYIYNVTVHGFTIKTLVECNVTWSAIYI